MKRILAVLLAGSLITMTACAGGKTAATTEKPQEKVQEEDTAEADSMAPSDITIAVVLKTLSSEYWNYVKAGCEAAEKDLGVRVVVVGPGAESEIAQQVAMIEEQLGQDMSAIICAPNDSSSAAAALAPAIGVIPVLFVDTDAELEGKTAFVGTGNEDAAALGGAYIAEKLGKGTRAVIIYGQEGEATSNARARGYRSALEAAGVEILAEQSGNNTTDGAMATMEDLLTRFPGTIDAVLCHNDDTALGALQACEATGMSGITIIGFDGNVTAVDSVLADGITGTVAQQPYQMGYTAVETALAAIRGEKVDSDIKVAAKLITMENAKEYLDELESMK